MNIEIHVQDDDSSSSIALHDCYPHCKVMLCTGHACKNHEKRLKKLLNLKKFKTYQSAQCSKNDYPNALNVTCCCTNKKHSEGCGCMTEKFVQMARSNFFRALVESGTDPEAFATRVRILGDHHSRNEHELEEGYCDFHPLTVCSCGKCKDNIDFKCKGVSYKTKYALTCPFHQLAYKIECDKRALQANRLVHPVLDKVDTNINESSHNTLTKFRSKDTHLHRLHYTVSTNLGLLQSNMKWMCEKRGCGYHWLLDLFKSMGLSISTGMVEALRSSNVSLLQKSKKIKEKVVKNKKRASKRQHRTTEQEERKKWDHTQKITHTYGETDKGCKLNRPTRKRAPPKLSTTHKVKRPKIVPPMSTSENLKLNRPTLKRAPTKLSTAHKVKRLKIVPPMSTSKTLPSTPSKKHSHTHSVDSGLLPIKPVEGSSSVLTSACFDLNKLPMADDLYCICMKPDSGRMVECSRRTCPYNNWFHYECVGVRKKPKGDWYCSDCVSKQTPIDDTVVCKCPGTSHKRDCPLNPRNKGMSRSVIREGFKVGDYVCIHKICEYKYHLPCRIVQVNGLWHRLAFSNHLLSNSFPASDLTSVKPVSDISICQWDSFETVSTKEAFSSHKLRCRRPSRS